MWFNKGVDVLYRDAPHIAFFSANTSTSFPEVDATIAATYFDTLAVASGLGTLWNGMNIYLFEDLLPELKSMINIPYDHKIVAAINFGYSATKYHRSIQADNPMIETIKL